MIFRLLGLSLPVSCTPPAYRGQFSINHSPAGDRWESVSLVESEQDPLPPMGEVFLGKSRHWDGKKGVFCSADYGFLPRWFRGGQPPGLSGQKWATYANRWFFSGLSVDCLRRVFFRRGVAWGRRELSGKEQLRNFSRNGVIFAHLSAQRRFLDQTVLKRGGLWQTNNGPGSHPGRGLIPSESPGGDDARPIGVHEMRKRRGGNNIVRKICKK